MVEVNIVYKIPDCPEVMTQVINEATLTLSQVCIKREWQEKKVIWGVEVSIVNDENIRKINKEWRKKDSPTDVLSFPLYESKDLEFLLLDKDLSAENKLAENKLIEGIIMSENILIVGDLVMSWESLLRQATQMKKTWQNRAQELTIHGLLHLWGYDHEQSEREEEMFKIENKLLAILRSNKMGNKI